jgi:N-acetylglucosamine kinase-like BadF-type ATPase
VSKYVIGIDGGNSKTDVVIASVSGELLARTRGPGVDSPADDLVRWRRDLSALIDQARSQAGVGVDTRAACAAFFLANVDLPAERRIALRELDGVHADLTVVHNDAVAVLRAGSQRPWGVAVVAGAGINAVGIHPDGRIEGFLALGDYTGDYGGGYSLGISGLASAIRACDGRGPATVLTTLIPEHFGLRTPEDVAVAVHDREIEQDNLLVLAPVVFAASQQGDEVARGILRKFGAEVATMATALIRRLGLTDTDVEVVLGGGVLQTGDEFLLDIVTRGVSEVAPAATVHVLGVSPVYGAVVEAFTQVGGDPEALSRLSVTLGRR